MHFTHAFCTWLYLIIMKMGIIPPGSQGGVFVRCTVAQKTPSRVRREISSKITFFYRSTCLLVIVPRSYFSLSCLFCVFYAVSSVFFFLLVCLFWLSYIMYYYS